AALSPRPLLFALSARSERALAAQGKSLLGRLERPGDASLADLAFSLATTREELAHRAVSVADDEATLRECLRALADARPCTQLVTGRADVEGKIVFVYPGQGGQWEGMTGELAHGSDVFRATLEECARALAPHVSGWEPSLVLRGGGDPALLERVDVV